jgi:hypothetical protein
MSTSLATVDDGQLDLFKEFQIGPGHLSRVLPLWDLLPLYLFAPRTQLPGDMPISKIPALHHEFESNGEHISVDVAPAILRSEPAAAPRIVFPGEREQLVSSTIRALAVRQHAALGTSTDDKGHILITVAFTIRQLRAELAMTDHTLSHTQIVEALEVLARSIATITRRRLSQIPIHQPTPYFYSFKNQGDKYIVTLNEIESQQIIAGEYRALDYTQLMELPDPLTRWLFQFIHTNHRNATSPSVFEKQIGLEITTNMLIDRGLLSPTSRMRVLIPRVRSRLDLLAARGVLHLTDKSPGYDEELATETTGGRRQILGAKWTLFVSEETFQIIFDSNIEAKKRVNPSYSHWNRAQRISDQDTAAALERLTKRTSRAAKDRSEVKKLSGGEGR